MLSYIHIRIYVESTIHCSHDIIFLNEKRLLPMFSSASTEKQAEVVLRRQAHNPTHTLTLAQVVANQAQKEYQTELRTFRNWDAAWLLMNERPDDLDE